VRELSRVEIDPQNAVFPEAKQLLRSRNQTTSKKEPAAEVKSTGQEPPEKGEATKAKEKAEPKPEELTRYFISSLDATPTSEAAMAQKIQAHWCCESRHWQRDAVWREDACLLRKANAACALALIRTALQTLLCLAGRKSLPVIFEDVAHDLSLGLDWLKSRRL
jgi:predicted transposase YbfD/YdcC